jgi:low temperature requirement protein LtrA
MTPTETSADLPVHPHGRKATWFELFFDLVFVVAVAQLSGAFSHHYDWSGAAGFAFGFLAMWWCWLGHTFFATRLDEDTLRQRYVGLAQIQAVVSIAFGASDLLGGRAWVFATGIATFKLLLALAYALCWRWRGARKLIRTYVSIYFVQAVLWAGSIGMSSDWRWALWGVAFALDLASPWLVARHTEAVPPHAEHLPERFGLFTIILLGEGMASSVHALDHSTTLSLQALYAAIGGALLTFMIWIGYFERARAHKERVSDVPGAGRDLRLWAYAHVPLYLGVAGLAAGTVHLAAQAEPEGSAQRLFAWGVTLVMLGLSLLGVASRSTVSKSAWKRVVPNLAIAGIFIALVSNIDFASIVYVYLAAGVGFASQLVAARLSDAR